MQTIKLKLKQVVHVHTKANIIYFMVFLFIFLYFLTGHFHLGEAKYFSFILGEENIPLLPWTIWIYAAIYPLLIWQAYSFQDILNFNRLSYAFSSIVVISCLIFFIYPVAYPREFYPLAFENDLTHGLFRVIRALDRPVNCFPSLHVGSIFLMAFAIKHESKSKFIFGTLSAVAISVSTLTTKQHYLADVLFGLTMALIHYQIFWKWCDVFPKKNY